MSCVLVAEMINCASEEKYAIVVPKLMSKFMLPNRMNRFAMGTGLRGLQSE